MVTLLKYTPHSHISHEAGVLKSRLRYVLLTVCWLLNLLQSPIEAQVQCYRATPVSRICIGTERGQLTSLEEIRDQRISPDESIYFYPEGKLMAHINWKNSYYLHFSKEGNLEEILFGQNYKAFRKDREIIDCVKRRCISSEYEFVSVPALVLVTGDVIFTGDLSPYTGLKQAELTHISIFAGFINSIPHVVSNDMYEVPSLSPMKEVIYNTHTYAVLRNSKFASEFRKYLEGQKPYLQKRFPFCSLMFFSLFQETFDKQGSNWPYFQRILPEYLFRNTYENFELISFVSQKYQSIEEMIQRRAIELETQHHTWIQMISAPSRTLYQMFLDRFPFLPLEFTEDKVENLLSLTASGLFQASLEFSPDPVSTPTSPNSVQSHIAQSSTNPGFQCYATDQSPRLCRLDYDDGRTRMVEIFTEGGDCPDIAVFLRPNGKLSHLIHWKNRYYFAFEENGNLKESLIGNQYTYFRDSKPVTKCTGNSCRSQELEFLSIPATGLRTGDVIFSANLYPYSGRARSKITHIEIVAGFQNNTPLVLTNDIYEILKILPLQNAQENTYGYVIARNEKFSREFQKTLGRISNLSAVPVPYFCANFYVELYSKVFPQKTVLWDQVDRNYAEQIFLNTIDEFQVVDMNLPQIDSIRDFRNERTLEMRRVREQITSIMRNPNTFLEQLFVQDFPMLPILFEQQSVHRLLQMMKIHHPWKLTNPPRWTLD